jgi:hypothetical protein
LTAPARRDGTACDVERLRRIGENFFVGPSEAVHCAHCSHELAGPGAELYPALARVEASADLGGPHIGRDQAAYVDELIVFRQYVCPHCQTASLTQVVPASRQEREDVVEVIEAVTA